MATSLVDRINSVKTYNKSWDNSYPYFGLSGLDSRNHDFTHTEYGAAQASQFIVEIDAALQVWEQWLDGMVWDIKDVSTGATLFSSDVRVIPQNERGARFALAIQAYRNNFKHSYWKSIVLSDWVVGETYIYCVPQSLKVPNLQWLNPLFVEPDIRDGKIYSYRYSADNSSLIGYFLPAETVAYRMMRRNLFRDLRGLSPIMSIIDESNLSRNVKRAFRNYFRNGMTLGGVMMPENPDSELSAREHEVATNEIRRSLSGTDNAHKWAILQRRMFIEQFQTKDASKDLAALDTLRKPIMMALGVPEELAGLTGDKTYENVEQARRAWWSMRAIPYAQDIATFHNNQIIPYIEPNAGIYLEPNTAKYEIEDPEVVSQDVNTGIIDLYSAAQLRGHEGDKDLAGIRIINGQPYSKSRLLKEANSITPETVVSPAGENGEAEPVSTQLGDVPTKEVFGYHIDAGVVTVNEARAQIGLKPLPEKSGSDLQELQSKLAVMVTATQAGIPSELSAMLVGLDLPKPVSAPPAPPQEAPPVPNEEPVAQETPEPINDTTPVDEPVQTKHIHFDGHDIGIEDFEPAQASALDELEAWRKASKNAKSAAKFNPYWLRGDIADVISAALEITTDRKAIHGIFDSAKETLEAYQKAIQATRLQFEDNFDSLLRRARDEKMSRSSWSASMRKIIRSSCRKAYEDGLNDGGVMDGLSDDDLVTLNSLITAATPYVTSLGATLYQGEGITDNLADVKASMWYNKTVAPCYQAGLASADGNSMYEWAVGNTEHCTDCKRLDGQRHRLRAWMQRGLTPQSDLLECGGYHCQCKLVKVKATARGNW